MTNDTQKMTVTSGGNVGVGTVTPTNKLVVSGTNAQPSPLGTVNTNATFRVDGSTNHALDFGTYTSAPFGSYISSQNKTSTTGLPLVLNPAGGNVGIGTDTPAAQLDIDGNLRIGTVTGTNSIYNSNSTLVRDNTTGEVKIVTSPSGNRALISTITYTLNNVQGDWVDNYDTKISTAEYTVVVVGMFFNSNLKIVSPGSAQPLYSPSNVFAYQNNNTWRLFADYPGTSTTGNNGTWIITCLIINNSIVKNLFNVTQDLGGGSIGAAAQPTGL
jgi:hypothetical protein